MVKVGYLPLTSFFLMNLHRSLSVEDYEHRTIYRIDLVTCDVSDDLDSLHLAIVAHSVTNGPASSAISVTVFSQLVKVAE